MFASVLVAGHGAKQKLSKSWFPLDVNRRRSVKHSLFLYLKRCAHNCNHSAILPVCVSFCLFSSFCSSLSLHSVKIVVVELTAKAERVQASTANHIYITSTGNINNFCLL